MVDESTLRLSFFAALFFVVSLFASWYRRDPLLDTIPTVGFSDPILSYFSSLRLIFDGLPRLKYGYEKTRRGLFKIATFRRWTVLASSPELIEDVRKAPDDVLSLSAILMEVLQAKYTLDLLDLEYHHGCNTSLDACIPVHGDNWVKVPVIETVKRVVCATTNRVFVGSPLCRNQDYLTLNLNFATNVMKFATIIRMLPKPLKPIVARVLSNLPSQIRQEMEFIRPTVEERFARMEEFGEDWGDKPNDMLMWLMNEAKGVERSLDGLARRLLAVNFAAIDTTSLTFTNVFYRLLANPEYIEPLRHEVETAVAEEGWTKAGLDKMHKIDSLIRETQRVDGLNSSTLGRLALRPFTFSNGVTVPAGTIIAAPTGAIHMDGEIFPNPEEFDGFRFAKLRECNGGAVAGLQALSTSPDNLTFGYGRHACPGRFFAVNEIKTLLAHIVVTYDIKFEEGKQAHAAFTLV